MCYYALAENHRHPEKGHVEARVVHSFGRADKLDRAVLERLVASIRRVLVEESGGPAVEGRSADGIEIEAVFELGVIHVVKALWEQLGIGAAITSRFEPLRKRGHSKEGRDNDPQIVIALAVTREGVPVRSWIFPGNTPDVTTVQKVKDDLREMRLGRTLFVGDAGMYSRGNLEELAKGAGKYILATPIRRVKEVKDEVLSHPGRYAEIAPNLRAKEVIVGDGERRRRYILCLNEEEANRQKWHRAEILETLKAELAALKKDHPKRACQLLASKRYGPYLSQDENGRPCLDQAKIKRAEHLDGKFVLTTNDDTLSVADIALGYKGMWIIESCFRRMKTTGLGSPADVPLDAAPHHRPRQTLRAGADDPARRRDRHGHDMATDPGGARTRQGRPLHRRGPIHCSSQQNPPGNSRYPEKTRYINPQADPGTRVRAERWTVISRLVPIRLAQARLYVVLSA
ncbi:MAG: transposase [Geminicoccaceae bacterium]